MRLATGAFLVQTIKFVEGNLTFVPSGIPKNINGQECLRCLKEEKGFSAIMRGCKVISKRPYRAGEIRIGVKTTTGPFNTIAESFQETGGQKRICAGRGNVAWNGFRNGIFMFCNEPNAVNKSLVYLEYGHRTHCQQMLSAAENSTGEVTYDTNKSNVFQWNIQCDVNELRREHFLHTMMVFRSIQIENPTIPARFRDELGRFTDITEEDVYRAGLSMKITGREGQMGYYYQYTTCGVYKWIYLVPFLAVLILILLLSFGSAALARNAKSCDIPFSSRSWQSFMHKQRYQGTRGVEVEYDGIPASGYFGSLGEEMVLVEKEGKVNRRHLIFRSGNVDENPEDVEQQSPASASDRAGSFEKP